MKPKQNASGVKLPDRSLTSILIDAAFEIGLVAKKDDEAMAKFRELTNGYAQRLYLLGIDPYQDVAEMLDEERKKGGNNRRNDGYAPFLSVIIALLAGILTKLYLR